MDVNVVLLSAGILSRPTQVLGWVGERCSGRLNTYQSCGWWMHCNRETVTCECDKGYKPALDLDSCSRISDYCDETELCFLNKHCNYVINRCEFHDGYKNESDIFMGVPPKSDPTAVGFGAIAVLFLLVCIVACAWKKILSNRQQSSNQPVMFTTVSGVRFQMQHRSGDHNDQQDPQDLDLPPGYESTRVPVSTTDGGQSAPSVPYEDSSRQQYLEQPPAYESLFSTASST